MSKSWRRPAPPRAVDVSQDNEERFFFDLESVRPDFRARSLCRQALEALSLAVSDLAGEPHLQQAWVAAVDPDPGPARLLVTVVLPRDARPEDLEAALGALRRVAPYLRAEVAQAIHRKRAPELAFRVVADSEVPHGA